MPTYRALPPCFTLAIPSGRSRSESATGQRGTTTARVHASSTTVPSTNKQSCVDAGHSKRSARRLTTGPEVFMNVRGRARIRDGQSASLRNTIERRRRTLLNTTGSGTNDPSSGIGATPNFCSSGLRAWIASASWLMSICPALWRVPAMPGLPSPTTCTTQRENHHHTHALRDAIMHHATVTAADRTSSRFAMVTMCAHLNHASRTTTLCVYD